MPDNPDNLAAPGGGRGRCTLADLLDPHRARGTAGILTRAIQAGYIDAFSVDYGETKRWAREMAQSSNERVQAAGVKLLTAMAMHDLKLVEVLDKGDRLDHDEDTEKVGHRHAVKYVHGVDPAVAFDAPDPPKAAP